MFALESENSCVSLQWSNLSAGESPCLVLGLPYCDTDGLHPHSHVDVDVDVDVYICVCI